MHFCYESLQGISLSDDGTFCFPSIEELQKYRIIVSTLVTAGRYVLKHCHAYHCSLFVDLPQPRFIETISLTFLSMNRVMPSSLSA